MALQETRIKNSNTVINTDPSSRTSSPRGPSQTSELRREDKVDSEQKFSCLLKPEDWYNIPSCVKNSIEQLIEYQNTQDKEQMRLQRKLFDEGRSVQQSLGKQKTELERKLDMINIKSNESEGLLI